VQRKEDLQMHIQRAASLLAFVALVLPGAFRGNAQTVATNSNQVYEHQETRELVAVVNDASELVRTKGEAAFADFRISGSRWRQGETYIFVLDPKGNMLVHPDPALEGKNDLDLKDINGKPIIRGLIGAATTFPNKPEGWYHYQWPVPGGILPRWKSTYVRLVTAPSGKSYVLGSGIYNDRMERAFVRDAVTDAAGQIEKNGRAAFPLFHDPTGPFIAKDAYIFVFDSNGIDLGDQWVLVGSGVYLADAPKAVSVTKKMTAPELMTLVREGATVLEEQGERAYPEFRKKGSKWFRDDTYFFVYTMDGTRVFHAANPASEGQNVTGLKDILGRPIGKMILAAAASPSGEGWVHYMYPEPGDIFPAWKSTFVKQVTFPSGKQYVVGCGIYNMQMDRAFVEDVVNHAATLVAEQGKEAFGQLRDKTGPFVFMDTYVFVESPAGVELVNPAQPSLEGKNIMGLTDLHGKAVVQEEIASAMKDGSAWLELYWYKPGSNTPARKQTYVRKVQSGRDTYIVGSGVYME
jgi:signal transduction histidine kinase